MDVNIKEIKEFPCTDPYYVGDDLLGEQLDELLEHVLYDKKNDTSRWLADKPHQVLFRLVMIAKRYEQGIPKL